MAGQLAHAAPGTTASTDRTVVGLASMAPSIETDDWRQIKPTVINCLRSLLHSASPTFRAHSRRLQSNFNRMLQLGLTMLTTLFYTTVCSTGLAYRSKGCLCKQKQVATVMLATCRIATAVALISPSYLPGGTNVHVIQATVSSIPNGMVVLARLTVVINMNTDRQTDRQTTLLRLAHRASRTAVDSHCGREPFCELSRLLAERHCAN